jgi:predicted ArsR family transcriptional regulator
MTMSDSALPLRAALDANEVRFTQRELREALQKSDRVLRRHLTRLVQLEYVVVHRTGRGNQRVYQLACPGREALHATSPLGLVEVASLRAQRSISSEPVAPPSQV